MQESAKDDNSSNIPASENITPPPEVEDINRDGVSIEEYAKKLKEVEKLANEYKSQADSAKKEVADIREKRSEDEIYLQTAVKVASSLYRRNTLLKNKQRSSTETSSISSKIMPSANKTMDDVSQWNDEAEDEKVMSDLFEDVYSMAEDVQKNEKLQIMRGRTKKYKNKCKELEDVLLQVNDDYVRTVEMNMQAQKEIQQQKYDIQNLEEKWQVETQVRRRAETYAAKMYGKNKAWKSKRSMMMPNKSEDEKVSELESEIDKLSKELEESKLESKLKIQELEETLAASNSGLLKDLEEEIEKMKEEITTLKEELETRKVPPPPPPPPILLNIPKVQQTSLTEQIAKNKVAANNTDKTRRVSAPPKLNNVMVNAMEELLQRIKTGNTGLKQTGLKPTAEEDKSPDVDPFDHIYNKEVKALKIRLTVRSKPKKQENNSTLYCDTLSRLRPIHKGPRVLRPVPEVPNLAHGLKPNEGKVFNNQMLKKTNGRFNASNDNMHPELRKILEKRKSVTNDVFQ